MEEHIYYNSLFDCYEELLTDNEKKCFLSYYSEDLSLGEIANNNSISRSAVHKTVKTVCEKLENLDNAAFLVLYSFKLKNPTIVLNYKKCIYLARLKT